MIKIKNIAETFFPRVSLKKINHGQCMNWAYVAKKLLPEAQIWSTKAAKGHVWIYIAGKFYDAETTNGVLYWSRLAFYKQQDAWFLPPNSMLGPISMGTLLKKWEVDKKRLNQLLLSLTASN